MNAIEIDGLVVRYGDLVAVDRLSLDVPAGAVTALLGPNGAGKSSVLTVLSTATTPSAGRVAVCGHDVARTPMAARACLGLVFQERTLDAELTVRQNLRFHARLFGVPRAHTGPAIDDLLGRLDLAGRADDRVEHLSGGLARRVEIARALLHAPRVLVLDEPTTGLDPDSRRQVWADLRRLRDTLGVTILFSTHYLDEAENADEVVIVHEGRTVRRGSVTSLKSGLQRSGVVIRTDEATEALARLLAAGEQAEVGPDGVIVRCADPELHLARLIGTAGVAITSVSVTHPSLDDVYLSATTT